MKVYEKIAAVTAKSKQPLVGQELSARDVTASSLRAQLAPQAVIANDAGCACYASNAC